MITSSEVATSNVATILNRVPRIARQLIDALPGCKKPKQSG